MKISDPLGVAARQLQDLTNRRWDIDGLIGYLNYGIREIVDKKPDAYPVTGNIPLKSGTVQDLPASALRPLAFTRNMGTGNNPGRAITVIAEEAINSHLPYWRTFPASAEVRHVILNPQRPKTFEIYPPQPNGTQFIEGIWSEYPAKVLAPTDDFPLDDSYEICAADYVVFRALKEETTIPNAQAKADSFYAKFLKDLGVKTAEEASTHREIK